MFAPNKKTSIPRFKQLVKHSDKLAAYPSLFLLGVIAVLLLMQNTAQAAAPNDPLELINRPIMHFNTVIDTVLVKPLGRTYQQLMPRAAKKRVGSVFSNLDDIRVIASDLLQFKFGQALSDTGRLTINSTLGLVGLFDVAASVFGFEKHDEDIGTAMASWNIPQGPYLVLPLLGPSTLRETLAMGIEAKLELYPLVATGNSEIGDKLLIVGAAHGRAALLPFESMIVGDRYTFIREMYLQNLDYRHGIDDLEISFSDF